jgi:hypothetical protein
LTRELQQQNLEGRKLVLVILSKNRWRLIKLRLAEIAAAVNAARLGTCSVVEISGRLNCNVCARPENA